jgi:hypothetical protein
VVLPRDLYESLRVLSFATGEEIEDHVLRAVRSYLDDEGHRAAVHGFGERARARYRGALDRLDEPSPST